MYAVQPIMAREGVDLGSESEMMMMSYKCIFLQIWEEIILNIYNFFNYFKFNIMIFVFKIYIYILRKYVMMYVIKEFISLFIWWK